MLKVGWRRCVSWLMAMSPIVFILWIAIAARVTNIGGKQFVPDSGSLKAGLEAHLRFVLYARQSVPRKGAETLFDEAKFTLAVEESKRCPSTVESTRLGASSASDLRAPIYSAQQDAFTAGMLKAKAAAAERRYDVSARYLIGALWIARILRYADSSSIARSSSQLASAIARLRECLPHLSQEDLKLVSSELLDFELRRGSVVDMMKAEHTLLSQTLASGALEPAGHESVAAAKLASLALRSASRGESLAPLIERVREISDPGIRNEVWSLIVGWDIALYHEEMHQRKLRAVLVEARSRQLAAEDVDPRKVHALGLPEFVFGETICGSRPDFVVTAMGASLTFTEAVEHRRSPSGEVAVR
jgi:hypothetical protein